MIFWESFNCDGNTYDLSHLHPKRICVVQPGTSKVSEVRYEVQIIYSLHTFTSGANKINNSALKLRYKDARETRFFDFNRYELSKHLPTVVETMFQRKCYHTGKSNYFTVEVLQNEVPVEYEVYFTASRATEKGVLSLYIQSAFARDAEAEHRQPKRTMPIRLFTILYNLTKGKPIKAQK